MTHAHHSKPGRRGPGLTLGTLPAITLKPERRRAPAPTETFDSSG